MFLVEFSLDRGATWKPYGHANTRRLAEALETQAGYEYGDETVDTRIRSTRDDDSAYTYL